MHEHALEGAAHGVVVGQSVVEGDGQALGDGRGDDAIDERHAEAVGEAGTDLAAAGAVGGREGDDRHVHASSRRGRRRNPIRQRLAWLNYVC